MSNSGKLVSQENALEITAWINQQLCAAGYPDQIVTDLGVDFSDGMTLIKLVQHITGRSVGHYHNNPLMRGQKLENIAICLRFLRDLGCSVRVNAEDIISGDINSITLLCNTIKHHFNKPPTNLSSNVYQSGLSSRPKNSSRITSLGPDDRELLGWISQIIHQNVTDYSNFYDGSILCDLVNSFKNKAIDYNDLSNLTPIQCLQVAFSAAESHLGITKGSIDLNKLVTGHEDYKLKSYLQHFRMIYQHDAKRKYRNSLVGTEQRDRGLTHEFHDSSTASLSRTDRNSRRLSEIIKSKRATSDAYLNMALDQGSNRMRQSISSEYINTLATNTQKMFPTKPRQQLHEANDFKLNSGTRTNDRSVSSNTPRHSSSTATSYTSDVGLPVTIYRTSSRSSIHSTSSRSSIDRYDDHHLNLTHLANLSHPSLPYHLESDHDLAAAPLGSSGVSDQSLEDIKERLKELTLLIEEEKTELIHKLMTTICQERNSRQSLEKQHKQLLKKANYLMQHYDGCLVDLAKDVAHIKQQMHDIQKQISTNLPRQDELIFLMNEVNTLKKQVVTGNVTNQHQQQPSSYDITPTGTAEKSKKTLFSRKKSDKT